MMNVSFAKVGIGAAIGYGSLALVVLVAASAGLAPLRSEAADVKGSRDHPLISRYAGSEIIGYDARAFDEFALLVKPATRYGGKAKNLDATRVLEGKITKITYRAPAGRSTLEVYRNYEQALGEGGFEALFTCKNQACGGRNFTHAAVTEENYITIGESYNDFRYLAASLKRPEGDVYLALFVAMANVGGGVNKDRVLAQLHVIEMEPMESGLVTVDADAMAKEIAESGRVALYGIYFDTDKAELKPESRPALEEIVKLLKAQSGLELVVVGHTDNVGSLDYNMKLSQRRAAAVERALVQDYGIKAKRLASWGVGYLSPVASNQTEKGRALNRRVELVEK